MRPQPPLVALVEGEVRFRRVDDLSAGIDPGLGRIRLDQHLREAVDRGADDLVESYSWFCERYSDWRKRITPTMRQTHVAGEKLFVDWAGDAIAVFDPITGAEHGARIFVAALGASNYVCRRRS